MTTTIKAAVLVVLGMMAAVPAAADDSAQAHVIAQASTGKLDREVSFLVCVNPDQVNVDVVAEIIHESAGLLNHAFPVNAQGRTAVNLTSVVGMPAVGNFSIALWMEAADTLGTSGTCDVVYYSGSPLREVERATLTVRRYVKR